MTQDLSSLSYESMLEDRHYELVTGRGALTIMRPRAATDRPPALMIVSTTVRATHAGITLKADDLAFRTGEELGLGWTAVHNNQAMDGQIQRVNDRLQGIRLLPKQRQAPSLLARRHANMSPVGAAS